MAEVAERLADKVIVTSDNPRSEAPEEIIKDILQGFTHKESCVVEMDRAEAIRNAILLSNEKDVVLIAGKGHENYQEIDGQRFPFSDVEEIQKVVA
jgi:UDP-N-acetylmuramoyl-L-alanyl-D-glutamate--2,6-diaminopimelate ligase